jgi:propionyl-CoA carboxylase alpha chain
MFKRILIANRGEIACRVIKTARRMGIESVAVYSEADCDALHVEMADEAVLIGPPAAAESYLVIDKIVEACRKTQAQAVHPGYGFLSEREAFPRALAEAGKGMRIAHSTAEVAEGFGLAKAEAKASFGDDRVFIEKFIVNPRHIEIQVLGDKHGNVIYLGERECSIQRRNQKVIEEAPSPLLDETTRRKMGEQAVALAKAVNYDSAGTVEFVAGQDKSFYFLEMNTRLQVEHPVTELITGVDLVEQMIRVSAGEKLKLAQKDVTLTGWAVESRLYAEDPFRNFLPSIGRLVKYRPPQESEAHGITVRNDTGVQEGGEISIYYDPMIAKLVTHAPSRAAAIEAQAHALDAFYIDGIRHNIPFLSALMNHPRWREGRLSTAFIAEEFPKGFAVRPPEGEVARRIAAVGAAIDHVLGERKRQISGQLTGRAVTRAGRRAVWLERQEIALDVAREGDGISVRFIAAEGTAGSPHRLVSPWVPGDPVWQGTIDGHVVAMQVHPIPNGFRLAHQGFEVAVYVFTEAEAALARLMPVGVQADSGKRLLCPMPGLVVSIAVTEGQEVKAGETLAVVEAMKMQNVLRAERDGTVKRIHATPGATLAVDAPILEFA